MIRTITYNEVLREAFLEKFVEQKQLQLEAPKSDVPPTGMYTLPNQPIGSYYAVYENQWYYFFTETISTAAFPGTNIDIEEQLSHKKVTNAAEIKKLNRRAKWFRKFTSSELQSLRKITPRDNTLTYVDTDGVETIRKIRTTPPIVIHYKKVKNAAQDIYDAKGLIDNESQALAVLSNINSSSEYWKINKTFMNQVDPKKRTIVEYLRSFLSTSNLCRAAWLLKDILDQQDYFVLKQLNTYAEIKKVATWVYRNMPNSIKNKLNSKEIKQFNAELAAMEISFPGGVGFKMPGNALRGTAAVNLKADYYVGLAQNLKNWHPDSARMVWQYLHSPKLYLTDFKDDLKNLDWRDFMSQVGSTVGQATYWTWAQTIETLRKLAYSPEGIIGTVVLDAIPYTKFIPKVAYAILLSDDIIKLTTGTSNDETIMNLIFDSIGVFYSSIIGALGKILRPLLRGLLALTGGAFKLSDAAIKYLVQFIQRSSKSTIALLEKIVGTKSVSNVIKIFKDALNLIKDTITDNSFIKNAVETLNKAIGNIQLYWVGMIEPFLQTMRNIIKKVAQFPGQTAEYIMQKLGYDVKSVPTKAVTAGVKTAPAAYGVYWAIENYAKWKSEYDLKALNKKEEEAFIKTNINALQQHVIGVPNVKRLESWKYNKTTGEWKSFGVWNNYEDVMSDAFGNIVPMEMVLYDTLKFEGESVTYIKVIMPTDPKNLETKAEVYIKRSEIDQVNTKPLKDIK